MRAGLLPAVAAIAVAAAAHAEPADTRIDFEAVRGLLAVQRLDGWLLYDFAGQNPIATELVAPRGIQTRRWFYYVPANGGPVALIPAIEAPSFDAVPGRKIIYASWVELDRGLREMLAGARTVAMEYSPEAAIPYLSRVDAGTVERVRARTGVTVVSSAELVQYTKSIWGARGLRSHAVAVHHLDKLRQDAFAFMARALRAGEPITEYQVQQRIVAGMKVRGLVAEPPIVAVNANAANPHYEPAASASSPIREGDLVVIDLWGRVAGDPRAIYADMTWMAYAGATVPDDYAEAFAVVARARDAAVALIRERVGRRRAVQGFEADQVARAIIADAGFGARFIHRTGHSIDTRVHGDGANLDDFETHDTRALVLGSGFSVEPGIYVPGRFGVRSEIDVYIGREGVVVTTPVQTAITPLLP